MEPYREITDNPSLHSAHFSSRAMAFIIDMTLLFFLALGFILYAGELILLAPMDRMEGLLKTVAFIFCIFPCLFLLNFIAYFTLLHSLGGKTLGKVFMGIRVESCTGGQLSIGISFLRLIGYGLSLLPVGLGFLWAVLDKDHAAWHDKLVNSRVVFDC